MIYIDENGEILTTGALRAEHQKLQSSGETETADFDDYLANCLDRNGSLRAAGNAFNLTLSLLPDQIRETAVIAPDPHYPGIETLNFPAGLVFPAGSVFADRCKFGDGCRFGDDCQFGDHCEFGTRCQFGDRCRFGADNVFGSGVRFGDYCWLGIDSDVPDDWKEGVGCFFDC